MEKQKQLKTRIQHKIDTYAHWKAATNFYPLKGELIIYTTDKYGNEKIGFKVGNGDNITNVDALPFVSLSEIEGGEGLLQQIQADWEQNETDQPDYIKNRPFYDNSWQIVWNGEPTNYFMDLIASLGGMAYRVTKYKEKNDIIGCSVIVNRNDEDLKIESVKEENIIALLDINGELTRGYAIVKDYGIIFGAVPSQGQYYLNGILLDAPAEGIYCPKTEVITGAIIEKENIKKIDEKFLPEQIDESKFQLNSNLSQDIESDKNEASKYPSTYAVYTMVQNTIDDFDNSLSEIIGNGVLV